MTNLNKALLCIMILMITTQFVSAEVDDKFQNIFQEINQISPETIELLEIENINDVVFIIGKAERHANISKMMRILKENNYSEIKLEYIKKIDNDLKFAINFKS